MLTCSTRSSFFTSSPSLSSVLISKRTSYVFPNLGGGPECCLARQTYWPKMHISLACINANKMSHNRSDPRWPCPSFDSRWKWPWGDNPTNKMHARKYYISYINRKVPIPQKTASCSCHFRLLLQGRKTHTLNMFQCGKCWHGGNKFKYSPKKFPYNTAMRKHICNCSPRLISFSRWLPPVLGECRTRFFPHISTVIHLPISRFSFALPSHVLSSNRSQLVFPYQAISSKIDAPGTVVANLFLSNKMYYAL